ncbi:MAG: efflux RND transporter permease subunit [Deltaproteobacteria bacterium]
MSFSSWVPGHRRSILFFLALLVLGGALSAFRLPVALFPRVDYPRIQVMLEAGDRPANQMVTIITRPVEEALHAIPGVRSIRSTTSRGSAEISIDFSWGHDMVVALLQVESAVNQQLSSLPSGTSFSARRMDATVYPIAAYSMTSSLHSLIELRDIAQYQLSPLLSAIDGVAKIGVMGGEQAEYRVSADPARLQAYELTLEDVIKAVSAANVLKAVGRLQDHYKFFLLLSDTRFRDLQQIRDTVLRSGKNGLVRLEDIATVEQASVPNWTTIMANGQNAVLLPIYQQPAGNTVDIVAQVQNKLKQFHDQLPKGVQVKPWYDQSSLVVETARSVRDALLMGTGLAALLLLLFLRNAKITLIAILVVPSVLATTILLLHVLNMTFNIMTLGGMAAAVGLIIDDAIVMIENITRPLHGGSGSRHDLIREAAREFTHPLSGSSCSTIIIFLPLTFLSGVTGAFFKALSLTMASALAVSFIVAWLAIPLLSEHLFVSKDTEPEKAGRISRIFRQGYEGLMKKSLAHPWLLAVAVLILVTGGFISYRRVGSGFLPKMDEGGFVLDYRAPPGTSLAETDRLLAQVDSILKKIPEIKTYSRRTGTQLGGGITETNQGDYFIDLKSPPRPSVWSIMDTVRRQVEECVPGLSIETAQLIEDLIGDLTAVPQPIEVKLFGEGTSQLMNTAHKVAHAIGDVKGIVGVRSGVVIAGDSFEIKVDPAKGALEGIDPENVTSQLEAFFSGVVTTKVQKGIKLLGIRVWVPEGLRMREDQLRGMWLTAPDGHHFPLKRIATVEAVTGQPQIIRDNLKSMVPVTARISGRSMGSVAQDVEKVLRQKGLLPQGIYYEMGGLYKEQRIAFRGLMMVFVAAVSLVFVLLLYLYEQFLIAISIILMPLLSIPAVFIGLWITGVQLNIMAMMGMTMIVGIVTEVAVFYFSEYRLLLSGGGGHTEVVIQAGLNRMRPIAMTTIAAILALLPVALSLGQGAAMLKPLAIAIISGLAVQMPLVLILMPVLFHRLSGRRGEHAGEQHHFLQFVLL